MGSGREGSPVTRGGSGAVLEEMSSSRLPLRVTRWPDPGVASTTMNFRSGGCGKDAVDGEVAAFRVEAFNSPQRSSCNAPANVASAGDSGASDAVKSSRKGPTRSNSAGSSHISAMKVEAVGSVQESQLGRQDAWNTSTGINLRSVSFRGGIGDLTEKVIGDVGEKCLRPSRVVEFLEIQDQSIGHGTLPRSTTVRSSTPRTRGGSQESVQAQVLEPSSRSQTMTRDSRISRSRADSPKRNHREEDSLQDIMVYDGSVTLEKASHIRTSRNIRQGSKLENQDLSAEVPSKIPELPLKTLKNVRVGAETQDESKTKATGRRSKTTRRQTKRKPDEAIDLPHEEGPELAMADHQPPTEVKEKRHLASRMPNARASTSSNSTSDSLIQLLGDVIMWKDIPRSTLYFGAGCFSILSTSYVRNTSFGALTITCYLALVYLAGIYCHRSYLGGARARDGFNWVLSESDILDMVKVVLPPVNLVISKCGQLFCGDPSSTLKVAAVLWVLAQLGYWISLWSFARLAFVAVFIFPKLFSYYSHQLQGHAEAAAQHVWTAWEEYAHKKAAVVGAFLVTWNFTCASTRLFGAFMLLVAVRAYYGQLSEEGLPAAARNGVEDGLPLILASSQEKPPRAYSHLKEVKMEPS